MVHQSCNQIGKHRVSIQLISLASRDITVHCLDGDILIVSIQLISLASRDYFLRLPASVSPRVSIQLISLASRDKRRLGN